MLSLSWRMIIFLAACGCLVLPMADTVHGQDQPDAAKPGQIDYLRDIKPIFLQHCAACHGAEAQGSWSTDAPALAGMSDWYLARQLENYRAGIRGVEEGDHYGYQMTSMVKAMRTEDQQNDVIAYINTLR